MIILTIRTDKPESEIGLFQDNKKLAYESWQAHRQLAENIHKKIEKLLSSNDKAFDDIEAIVCYKGPGSFTGLRIGLSVANALSSGLEVPIAGESGEGWIQTGIKSVISGKNDTQVLPEYGAPVHITKQKK